MIASYSRDVEGIDQPVYDAAAERPGKPIRVRIQPSLYRVKPGGGEQTSWAKVSWLVECESAEEVIALREAMREFFDTVTAVGAAETVKRLQLKVRPTAEGMLR